MKVSGPGSAGDADAPAAPDGPEGQDGQQGVDGPGAAERDAETFASKLDAASATGDAAPAAPADRLTADLAEDLRAGRVGADAALDQVVERIIDAQIGPDAPAAVRDSLRAALRDALANDPYVAELAAKLRGVQGA